MTVKGKNRILLVFFLVVAGLLVNSRRIYAASYQKCAPNSSCTIGEFLYDDSYAAITDATCNLNGRNPAGVVTFNNESVAHVNDGWYAKTFSTSGYGDGVYPTKLCCVTGTQTLCIDKTFTVSAADLTQTSIDNAVSSIKGVGNKDISEVSTSVAAVSSVVESLSTQVATIGAGISQIASKWGNYSAGDIVTGLADLQTSIGTNTDICGMVTVFGRVKCISDKWGTQTADAIYTAVGNAQTALNSLRGELNYQGKSTNAYDDLQTLMGYVDTVETLIGSSSDTALNQTLFGRVRGVGESALDQGQVAGAVWDSAVSGHTAPGSFGVNLQNPTLTAGDIWGYANRSLTTFGTLIADIWSYSTRSLTSFGTLVSDVWGNAVRTLTSGSLSTGSLATTSDVEGATSAIKGLDNKDNSQLSNQIAGINGIVSTMSGSVSQAALDSLQSSLSGQIAGVSTDIDNAVSLIKGASDKDLSQVFSSMAEVKTDVGSLLSLVTNLGTQTSISSNSVNNLLEKWGSYSMADVISSLGNISGSLGSVVDGCVVTNTLMGKIACLNDKWGGQTAESIYNVSNNALTAVANLRSELDYNGKSITAYQDLQTLKGDLVSLATLIGNTSDTSSESTVFGKMKYLQSTVESLNTTSIDLSGLLAKWGDYSAKDIYDKVKDLSSQISGINSVEGASSILDKVNVVSLDFKELKNAVLSMQAVVKVNQQLLVETTTKPVIQSWLEEGSIVFKNMITNPSSTTRQSIPLKFYLPREAKLKDVMTSDPNLNISFDASEDALMVSGEFSLGPKETKVVAVEVQDVWKISDSELETIKGQVSELFETLRGTAYFAQGTTVKSDILVSLEKISRIQKEAKTPQARIMAYREALAEFSKVKDEIEDLKTLVTSVSSNRSMLGFVGGSQLLSVWGIVLVVVTGFVLLWLFLSKGMMIKNKVVKKEVAEKVKKIRITSRQIKLIIIMAIIVSTAGFVVFCSMLLKKNKYSDDVKEHAVSGVLLSPMATENDDEIKYVKLSKDIENLTLRSGPSVESGDVSKAQNGLVYKVLESENDEKKNLWLKLELSFEKYGWGMSKYFEEASKSEVDDLVNTKQVLGVNTDRPLSLVVVSADVMIANVRKSPDKTSEVLKKLSGGIVLERVSEKDDWVEVKLSIDSKSGVLKTGWINRSLLVENR